MLAQSYIKKTNVKCFIDEIFFVILHRYSRAVHNYDRRTTVF